VRFLFDHYCSHPEALPPSAEPLERRVVDYVAGMTDRYCIRAYEELAVPRAFAL
jgi:dGTPase